MSKATLTRSSITNDVSSTARISLIFHPPLFRILAKSRCLQGISPTKDNQHQHIECDISVDSSRKTFKQPTPARERKGRVDETKVAEDIVVPFVSSGQDWGVC
jgi:hypothetical protein